MKNGGCNDSEGHNNAVPRPQRKVMRLLATVLMFPGTLLPQSSGEIPRLIQDLHASSFIDRSRAATSLAKIGSAAIPALIDALKDRQETTRLAAGIALQRIGQPAIPALINTLGDSDPDVRSSAVTALGFFNYWPGDVIPALTRVLKDPVPRVRGQAALALRDLARDVGSAALPAVSPLSEALRHDQEPSVRIRAAIALRGILGPAALDSDRVPVPLLTDALQDEEVRSSVAQILVELAQGLQDKTKVNAVPDLERAQNELAIRGLDSQAAEVRRAVDYLKLRRNTSIEQLFAWAGEHRWWTVFLLLVPSYLLWFVVLRFIVLVRAPLRVLAWNEALTAASEPTEVNVSFPGSSIKLPLHSLLKNLLFLGRYHYHPQVLNAWVEAHLGSARETFENLRTVEQRKTFVNLPVLIKGRAVSVLTQQQLQDLTARERWCLLVKGEGGLGKTALACQFARWAMRDEPLERLCRSRRMIPVLLEPDVKFDVRSDVATFQRELRGRLQQLIGAKDPISDGLFQQLLRDRRVLVILDGLSEMPSPPASRERARPENPDFPANALVITTRGSEKVSEALVIEPQRVDSTHLLGFINSYLAEAGQTQITDTELFDASRRLADLVSMETGITPLLARLFAEQLVDLQRRKESVAKLPKSVPDLMLAYINSLNRDHTEGDPDDPTLHQAAELAAWECVHATFRPGQPGSKVLIREALAQAKLDQRVLERLEMLRVLKTIEPAKTHVRFELDPLSEYLAALKLLKDCRHSAASWRTFLKDADSKSGAPEAIRGFLLAVSDCCKARANDCQVPDFLPQELAKRLASTPPPLPLLASSHASNSLGS